VASQLKQREFERRLEQVESLVGRLEELADEQAKATAVDAVKAVLELHGQVLGRMLELMHDSGPEGMELIDMLGREPAVAGLLILHGLHPLSLEDRVVEALDKVRPYLGSHGGGVQLLGVSEGVVSLRLEGSCHGCASSQLTLKHAIEQSILDAAPDVTSIEVEGVQEPEPAGFVPLSQIKRAPAAEVSDWQAVAGLEALEPGGVLVREVAGRRVFFCRLGENWYAYGDRCPGCGHSFESGATDGDLLSCPGCGLRFDVRLAGRCVGSPEVHLEPLPLLNEGGEVRVAAVAATAASGRPER
jgi:Fe-S cluster biogenesis protein NfuA/nitrite reductase/ring-hydroxylating ferredoxin subunit